MSALRLIVTGAIAAGLLGFAPGVQAREAAGPSLEVTFFANGTISVTLPDGTAVGSTSGAPTVIPAGYYTVLLTGPGGCTYLPYFELKGPGESIVSNLDDGEVMSTGFNADLLPSSTYTWRNDATTPPVVYTFTTSAQVQGAPPVVTSTTPTMTTTGKTSNSSTLGSGVVPLRGALTGSVSATGQVKLSFEGKPVTTLAAGRYTLTVDDESTTGGFMLEKADRPAMTLAGSRSVGRRSVTVDLTAGRWLVAPRALGKKTYFTVLA